ncbi:MAG: acetyltransferase [Actinomycetota bacterium]|nr:acetyltransferase [Actinomycetota bacterium]
MTLVLLGGGGHAREVLDLLHRQGIPSHLITVYVEGHALATATRERYVERGHPVVTSLDGLAGQRFVAAVGNPALRRKLVAQALEADLESTSAISIDAIVSPTANITSGAVVFPHAVVGPEVFVDEHAQVNQGARLSHDAIVGAHATVGPGVLLTGGTRVGADAVLGAGAIVLPGREVGTGAIVGAGAVVVHDVAAGETVVGNPARPLTKA